MTRGPDAAFNIGVRTPEPPYYAVIFSSQRRPADDGYAGMAETMLRMALAQPGCLGAESARDAEGFGITVSYWRDEASIRAWKARSAHRVAQDRGRSRWYEDYAVRVARVERAYTLADSSFDAETRDLTTASPQGHRP